MPAKLMPRDEKTLRAVVEWGLLTVSEVRALADVGKPVVARRRLQTLGPEPRKIGARVLDGLRYLQKVDPPDNKWGEPIWFPDQKAYDLAYNRGWTSQRLRAVEKKRSNTKLVHDRLIVAYRFILWQKYGERLNASRFYYNLNYTVPGAEKEWYADLLFYLDLGDRFPLFFLEWENTDLHSYEKGVPERIQKAQAFIDFKNSGTLQERFHYPDGRMIFVCPTARQAENLAKRLRDMGGQLASGSFWITDFDRALSGEDKIFMTPRDFETRRYSLEEA
jgi:hypothetical protein